MPSDPTHPAAASLASTFRALHVPGRPLLMPNPWDAGSARLLASVGFPALATTSSGYAGTLGRRDGGVTQDEALAHAAAIVAAVDVPVSADLEDGFGAEPEKVAETVRLAAAVGLAGCSVEDATRDGDRPVYELQAARDRVVAAAEAARASGLVLTVRAENYLYGRPDLADTIGRLQAYQEAGADVLYAPGLTDIEEIRQVVAAVDRPVNVLTMATAPPVAELAAAGVARISVGGSFSLVAAGAVVRAARELLDQGTYSYYDLVAEGRTAIAAAYPE
jgi:2-methylisocitrate lyase-like PEP mutase family enzyme